MIPSYRKQFNNLFTEEKYQEVQDLVTKKFGLECGFRLSETPIFLSKNTRHKLLDAAESIIEQIKGFSDEELRSNIPDTYFVPGDTSHPHFLAIDFALTQDETGEINPMLIELQAFPSLFAFKPLFEDILDEVYPFLSDLKTSPNTVDYTKKFRSIIVGEENPENVILLEINPLEQKTMIDFAGTKLLLGIETVNLADIIKEDKKLYYIKDGKKTAIHRIYNRVILDELDQLKDFYSPFNLRDEVDVEWITHPNWFYKISKALLPKLSGAMIPECYFLDQMPTDLDVKNYVLKPLYSFAGSGVDIHPTQEKISKIEDKKNYILQKKVEYAPLFEDIEGEKSKAEIRLLYWWHPDEPNPELAINLVRMTKAEMVNVSYNKKDAIWIGSSLAIFID